MMLPVDSVSNRGQEMVTNLGGFREDLWWMRLLIAALLCYLVKIGKIDEFCELVMNVVVVCGGGKRLMSLLWWWRSLLGWLSGGGR
jgi:hypothetical protein